MKRISRGRYLTREEAAKYDAVRAAVEAEKPEINARILARMAGHPSFGSPEFRAVVKRLVELHRLIKNGQGDTPEAEAVRDALDPLLNGLNRIERERAQFLSEDLYSVGAPPAPASEMTLNSAGQHQLNEAFEARENREWDRALALFRGLQASISPDLLSYYRGRIWDEAGYPAVAAEFFRHASDCDPANERYRRLYLEAAAVAPGPEAEG
jgi:hypothetical protein